jgi:MbtH protein
MSNPLDDETALFHVLINPEGQYSLWPVFAAVPAGWDIVLKDAARSGCLAYIDSKWTDMRPRSLRESMRQEGEN